jgi:hypothetical protein
VENSRKNHKDTFYFGARALEIHFYFWYNTIRNIKNIKMIASKKELIHYKIQAAMREHYFEEDQMKYLGERDGNHWYLIDGKHEVSADQFEDFEVVE